jgi:hypothetical protein
MSHESMFSGATSSEAISPPERDETIPQAHTGFSNDAELVIAAIARMQAAMRGERAAFARLQGELEAMAKAIAQARAHLQGEAIESDAAMGGKGVALAALLDEIELRVDTMRELAGQHVCAGAPALVVAPPPPAEQVTAERAGEDNGTAAMTAADAPARAAPGRVPTVSDVVSRLGRLNEEALPASDRDKITPPRTAHDVPTVSMLEAMVEALTASAPAAPGDSRSVADADGDPAAFLFEPEPERQSDPAQFSSQPAPAATDGTPPQSDAAAANMQDKPQTEAAATAAPADPLAPLKAMSEEEKIALFS